MTKQRKTVEKPEGRGVIQLPDHRTFRVRYALAVVRTLDDDADTGGLTSQVEIRGAIEVSQDEATVNLSGKTFILKTDDGRCLEAMAKWANPLSRQWEIVSSGPRGLEPC